MRPDQQPRNGPPSTGFETILIVAAGGFVGLGSRRLEILDYENRASGLQARISRFQVITLAAKNGTQLSSTYELAKEAALPCNVFVTSMLGESAEQQLTNTAEAAIEALEYVGIAIFGTTEQLHPLTKRCSLLTSLS